MQSHDLGHLGAPGAGQLQELDNRPVAGGVGGVEFEDEEGQEVLLLEEPADLAELWLFVLGGLFESFGGFFVEEGDGAVEGDSHGFVLDHAEDEAADEHAFEEDVELHGGLGQQEGDELPEVLELFVVSEDVDQELLVVLDELVDLP